MTNVTKANQRVRIKRPEGSIPSGRFILTSMILSFYKQFFSVVQQLDHHLADVLIEVVMFQRGEGQKARARNNVDTTRCAAETNERCVHFPFSGGIEEGEFLAFLNITAGIHL